MKTRWIEIDLVVVNESRRRIAVTAESMPGLFVGSVISRVINIAAAALSRRSAARSIAHALDYLAANRLRWIDVTVRCLWTLRLRRRVTCLCLR